MNWQCGGGRPVQGRTKSGGDVSVPPADQLNDADLSLVARLRGIAVRGLAMSLLPSGTTMAFTRVGGPQGSGAVTTVGSSLRYGAIAALGAGSLEPEQQRAALGGATAREFCGPLVEAAAASDDPGAVALVCWAAAELGHASAPRALERLLAVDDGLRVAPTVEAAWTLTALLAARQLGDTDGPIGRARGRLLAARHPGAVLFPHTTSPSAAPWYRRHVGCFADQVYPIQALARLHAQTPDPEALQAAADCAEQICRLQGAAGQWWWHYDARTDGVVEGYPVYSVHQHAMAPMALADLEAAGGPSHHEAVALGLGWLTDRPETPNPLIRDDLAVVWRKVGRREPRPKAVRAARGLSTALSPRLRVPGVDTMFPAGPVDHECRPYELGWLLYAWPAGPAAEGSASR